MIIPFFFTQIRKRLTSTIAVIVLAAGFAFTFCVLDGTSEAMEQRIAEVYDNLPVRCTVTNATGTRQDNLDIPYSTLCLFLYGTIRPVDTPSPEGFHTYIRDLQIRTRLSCRTDPTSDDTATELNGLTSLEAIPALQGLAWNPGMDDRFLSGDALWCIAPNTWPAETVTLYFSNKSTPFPDGAYDLAAEFTVVGTWAGAEFYCPWNTAAALSTELTGAVTAQSISATIADNRKIDTFRENWTSKYFVEPDITLQNASGKLGFLIYDDMLNETIRKMEQNQLFLSLALGVLMVVSFAVGLVFSILMLRHRFPELRLQRILGVEPARIFAAVLLEQGVLCAAGIGLGAGLSLLIRHSISAAALLALFWGVYLAGTILAYLTTTRKGFLETNKGGD